MADDTELAEGEHTVLLLHPHWKILLRPTLILLLVAAAAAVVLLMIPPGSYATTGRIAVGVLAVVVAVTWFGVPFLRWQTTTYELTTRRLRLREGILSRSGRDFPGSNPGHATTSGNGPWPGVSPGLRAVVRCVIFGHRRSGDAAAPRWLRTYSGRDQGRRSGSPNRLLGLHVCLAGP